ncbi:MAG: hypothetical protein ACYDBJ_09305 [Aggregatilineales bacterium]
MVDKLIGLDEVVAAALRLSPVEKVRLVERVVSTLESDVIIPEQKPLETFKGILAHLGPGPSDEDIAEARREMMRNFPREDF